MKRVDQHLRYSVRASACAAGGTGTAGPLGGIECASPSERVQPGGQTAGGGGFQGWTVDGCLDEGNVSLGIVGNGPVLLNRQTAPLAVEAGDGKDPKPVQRRRCPAVFRPGQIEHAGPRHRTRRNVAGGQLHAGISQQRRPGGVRVEPAHPVTRKTPPPARPESGGSSGAAARG